MNAVGARLIKLMADRQITVRSLADKTGYSKSSISRWRKGGDMSASQIIAVCNVLHVSPDELLEGNYRPAHMLRRLPATSRHLVEQMIKHLHAIHKL